MERVNKKFTNPVCFFLLVHTIVQQNAKLPINAEHCRRFQVFKLDFSIFPGFLQHFFNHWYKFFTGFERKLVMELFVLRAMEGYVIFCILKVLQTQLIITTFLINAPDTYCTKYGEERLLFSLPPGYALSSSKDLYFDDLNGETILLYSEIGFWHEIHERKMPSTHFLVQNA